MLEEIISKSLEKQVLKQLPGGPVIGYLLPNEFPIEQRPSFKFSRWTLASHSWSDHDEHAAIELWLIADGTGNVYRDGKMTRVSSGDAIVMLSNVVHRIYNTGDSALIIYSIWWDPDGITQQVI